MNVCGAEGCVRTVHAKGLCKRHYLRVRRHGSVDALRGPNGGGYLSHGYRVHSDGGKRNIEHNMIVEKILGRKLRWPEEVHHSDKDRANNTPSNLVVCPNHAYHMLLHVRMRALDNSGNANYRKCKYCHQYDDPVNLYINGRCAYHSQCVNTYNQKRKGDQI